MTSQYAWRFPDGTKIPVEDVWEVKNKLIYMPSFRDRVEMDCLRDGVFLEAYRNWLEMEITEQTEERVREYYGVTPIERRDGTYYRLPDGRIVSIQDLFYWLEFEGGFPFEEWQQNGDLYEHEVDEAIENEADYLTYWNNPDDFAYYGIKRVPMGSPSGKGGSNPKPKAPAKKAPARRSSASKSVKAGTGKGGARTSKPRGKGARR